MKRKEGRERERERGEKKTIRICMLLDVSTASRTCHILTGIQRVKTLETLEAGREGGGRGTCE